MMTKNETDIRDVAAKFLAYRSHTVAEMRRHLKQKDFDEDAIAGLIDDFLSSSPLGSNIFEMLLLYVLINNTSRLLNAKPFVVLWCGFAALSLVTLLGRWLIVSVYYSKFLPLSMLFFGYLVTIAVYPLVSLLLAFVQNRFMKDDD